MLRYIDSLLGIAVLASLCACVPVRVVPTETPILPSPTSANSTVDSTRTATLTVGSTGSAPVAQPTSTPASLLVGEFVYQKGDGTIHTMDASTGRDRLVFDGGKEMFGTSPVFSPDGKQIAFSGNAFTKENALLQDIRIMNADGTSPRVLIAPPNPKIAFSYPMWSPDGKEIFFTQAFAVPPSSQHFEIDRVSVAGSSARKVIDDAREAHVSPDGKRIVFQRTDFTALTSGMWIANVDGTGAKQLIENGAFAYVFGARFSLDSTSIVFAAAGKPQKKLPGYQGKLDSRESCYLSFGWVCVIERAEAHLFPWEIWLVNVEGTRFEQLTQINADSPVPAWSANGRTIAWLDESGRIFTLDRVTQKVNLLRDTNGGFGGFDWR